jgi:hypothetical protein
VGINSIKGIRSYLPIAFEIHITVDVSEDFSRVDKFREDCVKIEVANCIRFRNERRFYKR